MATTEQDKRNRTWQIYEHDQIVLEVKQGTKTWEISADDYPTDDEFLAAAERELAALAWAADRLGRGFTVLPIRVEVDTDRYRTVSFRFQDGFVPAARLVPQSAAEQKAEEEPEVAETPAEPVAAA